MLGRPCHDFDYVVVGATPQDLLRQGYIPVGKSFPVFLHPETRHEYALARKEIKTGLGHQGFFFNFSKDVTLEEDLLRRDFTINAMAQDESGHLIDPFGGLNDLKQKVLRPVSAHFIEDPLRVWRGLRFCAQLGFSLHGETILLIQQMKDREEFQCLSMERVRDEWQKAFAGKFVHAFFSKIDFFNLMPVSFNIPAALCDLVDAEFLGDDTFSVEQKKIQFYWTLTVFILCQALSFRDDKIHGFFSSDREMKSFIAQRSDQFKLTAQQKKQMGYFYQLWQLLNKEQELASFAQDLGAYFKAIRMQVELLDQQVIFARILASYSDAQTVQRHIKWATDFKVILLKIKSLNFSSPKLNPEEINQTIQALIYKELFSQKNKN